MEYSRVYTVEDISDADVLAYSTVFQSSQICTYNNRCGVSFSDTEDLKMHLMNHFNNATLNGLIRTGTRQDHKYFSCKFCQYGAPKRFHVMRHVMVHLNMKDHQCPHCPYKSNRKYNMISHIKRRHPLENKYEWNKC